MLYIDGRRLYRSFAAGSRSVMSQREYLNRINVFPVPDADTGANLSATLQNIIHASHYEKSLKQTAVIMAENALTMARGNSGIIFSQFLYGISKELEDTRRQQIKNFSQAIHRAVNYMYDALVNPVEGTMITVIREWAEAMLHFSQNYNDIIIVLDRSLERAAKALQETQNRLEALKKARVVDAGGLGFVLFLEGIINYLKTGEISKKEIISQKIYVNPALETETSKYRYCCETLITNLKIKSRELVKELQIMGDSLALAGDEDKLHLHIHCNNPTQVFHFLSQRASIASVKIDDIAWQHDIQYHRRHKIGLITDSAADLPQNLREKYQINTIPIKLIFGDDIYLDKVTIDSESFFDMIESGSKFPHSSQPDPGQVSSVLDFVCSHFHDVISISLSSKLSGVYNLMQSAAENNENISVFDSRHLSVSQGLFVLRVAEAIDQGMPYSLIIKKMPLWRQGSWIFTDIHSLNYLVRGGRISPLKGKIAKLLNLKPIISVDDEGKGIAWGKSFSRHANMNKIIKLVTAKAAEGNLWNYAIVHARCRHRADTYAKKLSALLNKEPLYIMDIGPVVGVHNGPGACAVGMLMEMED
jgi:uncharacterized protein